MHIHTYSKQCRLLCIIKVSVTHITIYMQHKSALCVCTVCGVFLKHTCQRTHTRHWSRNNILHPCWLPKHCVAMATYQRAIQSTSMFVIQRSKCVWVHVLKRLCERRVRQAEQDEKSCSLWINFD